MLGHGIALHLARRATRRAHTTTRTTRHGLHRGSRFVDLVLREASERSHPARALSRQASPRLRSWRHGSGSNRRARVADADGGAAIPLEAVALAPTTAGAVTRAVRSSTSSAPRR